MENLNMELIMPILMAIGIIIVFRMLSSTISKMIIRILRRNKKEKSDVRKNAFYKPLKTIITFAGIYIALNMLKETIAISATIDGIISKAIKIAMIIFVAKAFGESLDERNGIFIKLKTRNDKDVDKSTISIILKTIKIVIYVIAGFMVISELGYNISGFITSLGIGGVVITLAAQDTAKSLIGGMLIFLDKPFKVGDYISVGTYEGTVEEIKFRSTNIRTLENSVLHIPNSEMSISAIINYSEMEKRRFFSRLTLDANVKLEKIESVKAQIIQVLQNRSEILQDTISVKLQDISASGIDIIAMAYINETNYMAYLHIKEQINYEIIQILQNEGVELVYNPQTIYVKK